MALLPIGQSPRHKQKLEIQPYPQDGHTGRRRCFADGSGSGPAAGGSRVDAMRDANVHGICSLKRGPTQIYVEALP